MKPHHIIFIHGISEAVIDYDYSLAMQNLIIKNLDPNLVKNFTFENVNYSKVGHLEEEMVLNSFKTDRDNLYGPIDNVLDGIAFFELRKQLIVSFSDAIIYQSDIWKEEIQKTVYDKINAYAMLGEDVTIIAHSLGSVVAFDTLYQNRHNKEWENNNFKVKNLFTLGSPIALFSLTVNKSEWRKRMVYYKPISLIKDNGVWFNFFDAQDVIGYPLKDLFKGSFDINDIVVQTGTDPITAHKDYWINEEIAKQIASKLV